MRLGGMVTYVESVIEMQSEDDFFSRVFVIFPWYRSFISAEPRLKIKQSKGKISMVGIVNANSESLMEGINEPDMSIRNQNLDEAFIRFITENTIQVVHFHTFYCLPASILPALHKVGVKIIFSAHDFQPLCPTINLLDSNHAKCSDTNGGLNCLQCNHRALTPVRYLIRNNRISVKLQSIQEVKAFVKKAVKRKPLPSLPAFETSNFKNLDRAEGFKKRQQEFSRNLSTCTDLIIYNSHVTKTVYSNHDVTANHVILPVSHKGMKNSIEPFSIELNPSKVRFGFMGGNRREKGCAEMLEVLGEVHRSGWSNFEIHLFGEGSEEIIVPAFLQGLVSVHGFCKRNAYERFDVLIVPSLCYETFGFVVQEALANKKGVIGFNYIGIFSFLKDGFITFDDFEGMKRVIEQILQNGMKLNYSGGLENNTFESHYNALKNYYNITLSQQAVR